MTTIVKPGLVLSRRLGEVLFVETGPPLNAVLQVSIVGFERGQVRVGIRCPDEWNVVRGELRDTMLQQRLDAINKQNSHE